MDFGTIIGYTPEKVEVYSCKNPIKDEKNYIIVNKKRIYTGIKYQCVELARRYLILTRNITFAPISDANQLIINPPVFTNINTNEVLKIKIYKNGKPKIGDLLIWDNTYIDTGHVAVITDIMDDSVCICEQNQSNKKFKKYSRKVNIRDEKAYRLRVL